MVDLDSYLKTRRELIAEDRSLRLDRTVLQNATPDELRAEEIIKKLKEIEDKSIWSVEHEGVTNTFAGMEFLSARNLVAKTKIFQILSKMPKGGLLHAHLEATVDNAFLLDLALSFKGMHIRTLETLTPTNHMSVTPQFRPLPEDQFYAGTTLCSPDYLPGTWISIVHARDTFDPSLGGPKGFDSWVFSALTINPNEAYRTHNSVLKIWEKFSNTFIAKYGITQFVPLMGDYIREFLRSSVEDGISYVEARVAFRERFRSGAHGENVTHREFIALFDKTAKDFKSEMIKAGRQDDFQGTRIIYTALRDIDRDELEWYTNNCLELKQEFPHLIAGFDLVGNENTGHPLVYYLEPLLKFRERIDELGLDLPFILHAGETLGDGTEADNNVYDAILLGTKRIGHGFSLVKHPKLVQLVKEKNIPLEVCPISNEILRLTSSMPAHPLPILLNNGVNVVLSSDDPSVFGNMGLSFDFFQVLVASEMNGLMTLKCLALQSLEHSTLSEGQKSDALAAFERQWSKFIKSLLAGEIVDIQDVAAQ